MPTASLHFLISSELLARDGCTAALQAASVVIADDHESAAAVIFTAVVDEVLFRAVREYGRGGHRVLVVLVHAPAPEASWQLLACGAADVIVWDSPTDSAQAIAAKLERWHCIEALVRAPVVQRNLVGQSPLWMQLLREVAEVARFTDASVLLMGESGTGKELVARLIHTLDPRQSKRELIVLDCTTVVPELSGSEFFGHERGAFTGAAGSREGAFALADGGTLFLDEVGELAQGLQAQILRAIQERTYKRVGGNQWQKTNFRLVGATNRDLPAEVEQGRFRRDLFHRLTNWVCRLPPLRERPQDLMVLIDHFVARYSEGKPPELDDAVRGYLLARAYPGNVRELQQLVFRICRRHTGPGPITVGDVPKEEWRGMATQSADWRAGPFEQGIRQAVVSGVGLREIGRAAEDLAVEVALSEESGSLQRAARRLHVTDRALQMRRASQRS